MPDSNSVKKLKPQSKDKLIDISQFIFLVVFLRTEKDVSFSLSICYIKHLTTLASSARDTFYCPLMLQHTSMTYKHPHSQTL